jgi:hypothetical protein
VSAGTPIRGASNARKRQHAQSDAGARALDGTGHEATEKEKGEKEKRKGARGDSGPYGEAES